MEWLCGASLGAERLEWCFHIPNNNDWEQSRGDRGPRPIKGKERGTSLEQIKASCPWSVACFDQAVQHIPTGNKKKKCKASNCHLLTIVWSYDRWIGFFYLQTRFTFSLAFSFLEIAHNTAGTSKFPSNDIHVSLTSFACISAAISTKDTKQGEEKLKLRSFTWHKVPVWWRQPLITARSAVNAAFAAVETCNCALCKC